jgi:hypothetical protein
MCGYTCRMFGAPYPDAECIEGYMWDLDSYEDGLLTSGGEIPCPSCKTDQWLSMIAEDAQEDLPQPGSTHTPASIWERAIVYALEVNGPAARNYMASLTPFEVLDREGRIESPSRPWEDAEDDDKDIVWRQWPWPISDLSKHDQIAIQPKGQKT